MTNLELTTRSSGNIGVMERAIRVALGLAVLFASLHVSIDANTMYPFVKILAAGAVLTGIAGWDPFYAAFRYVAQLFTKKDGMNNTSINTA